MTVASSRKLIRRQRPKRRWVVVLSLVLVAGLAVSTLYWQWQRASATPTTTGGPQTVTVNLNTYQLRVSGPGTLEPSRSFGVATVVAGTVQHVVEVGERVAAGSIIATLDPTPFERALTEARFTLTKAEAQVAGIRATQQDSNNALQNNITSAEQSLQSAQHSAATAGGTLALTQRLYQMGSESAEVLRHAQNAYEQALAALETARANLSTLHESRVLRNITHAQELTNTELSVEQARLVLTRAEEDLAATVVTAPFDGVVAQVNVQEGSRVAAGAVLLTVISDQPLRLVAQIDETEIGQVRVGQTATVTVDAMPIQTFTAAVTAVAPQARLEQNIPIFEVTLIVENKTLALRPGMTAEAEILVRELADTVTLPSVAVQTVQNRSFVQVEQEDGSFTPHPVQVIDTLGFTTIVQTDLAPGSVVLVAEAGAARGVGAPIQQGFPGGGIPFPGGGR